MGPAANYSRLGFGAGDAATGPAQPLTTTPPEAAEPAVPSLERERTGPRLLSALLAAGAAAIVTAALYALYDGRLYMPPFGDSSVRLLVAYGLTVVAAAAGELAPRAGRLAVQTMLSLATLAVCTGPWLVLFAFYAALVVLVARLRLRARVQLALALAAWAAFPCLRWMAFAPAMQASTMMTVIVWMPLLYATVFLIVERARRPQAPPSLGEDVFYLLALPRVVAPFFQPVSQSRMLACRRRSMTAADAARAVRLGVLGALCIGFEGYARTHFHWLASGLAGFAVDYLRYYAEAAGWIFVSMALMRCLGFAMPSGFNLPLLSTSFADYFRRWNLYVRDAVLAMFFYPFLGVLRRHLPPRAATIGAAYAGIFVGSFLLNDLLIPAVTNSDPVTGALMSLQPTRLVLLVVFWSAIILPQTLRRRPRTQPMTGARRVGAVATFLVLYFALWGVTRYLNLRL